MISTQEEWRQQITGAWLRGAKEMILSETKAYHQKRNVSTPRSQISKRFEQIELRARLIHYFLWSNKNNINHYLEGCGIFEIRFQLDNV